MITYFSISIAGYRAGIARICSSTIWPMGVSVAAGGASPSPTVGTEAFSAEGDVLPSLFDVARVLKSLTTRRARPLLGDNQLWQCSCHEHVIRNEEDYRQIWEYIDANPAKWAEDRYYRENRE